MPLLVTSMYATQEVNHSQHLETIKIILNLINLKYNNVTENYFSIVEPKLFKFYPINVKGGSFKIGSMNKNYFSYDNEKPLNSSISFDLK